MRRTYLLMLFGLLLLPLWFVGCSPPPKMWTGAKIGQKKILVSFPPLYALTHAIGGDDAYVLCLLTTQGPHDYDGSPTDLLMVNEADLFIYNGLSLDDEFVSKMLRNHRNKSLQTLSVGGVLKDRKLVLENKDAAAQKGHEGHDHGDHDPHIWLGARQAIEMARVIAEQLSELDPDRKKKYQERRDALIVKLQKLHDEGKAALKDKKNKKIVTMHEAFRYFADKDYGFDLDIKAVIQMKPGLDPDPVSLARLIDTCKDEKVALITKEPQYSDAQAEMLQRSLKSKGIDIKIVTLDPLETAPPMEGKVNPDPDYYFKKMRENIDTLAKALP